MAEGDGLIVNAFKEDVLEGAFNLASGGDSLYQLLLTGHTPDIDNHAGYADISGDEYSTASGYVVGGTPISGQDVTQDNTNDRGAFDATDVTYSSLGPLSPGTPSHTSMVDRTVSGTALIATWELGSTPTNGGDYVLSWGANGIILTTQA